MESLGIDTPGELRQGARMTWEARLFELFDDLEQQAEGLALQARDVEVAELGRAQYAEVDLASRLHASVGHRVELALAGSDPLRGRLLRVARGWCLIAPQDAPDAEWVVNLRHLVAVRGLAVGAAPEASRGIAARVGIGSALRGLAEERDAVAVLRVDGRVRRGRLGRVGADFLELMVDGDGIEVVATSAIAVVRRVA